MSNIVYFDLETQLSFNDVGGYNHKDQMKVSVAVTYSTAEQSYQIYPESEMDRLVDTLCKADLVVGYNHIQFDYQVLQGYTILDLASQTTNLDMMVEIEKILGFRLKLDSLASATLGIGKIADGLEALRWWQEYKKTGNHELLLKIARYCSFDVKVTKNIHEHALEHKILRYADRQGTLNEISLNW